jgi:uncharacterized membrane protein YgdD (TMEM256/DUF423 family)
MVLGALSGLIMVAMAAYASHGLPPETSALAMIGVQLQAWHALALFGVGLLAERRRSKLVHAAGACFALGSLLFCGGVYLRALAEMSIGLVTPAGGMLLLLGWALLAAGALAPDR